MWVVFSSCPLSYKSWKEYLRNEPVMVTISHGTGSRTTSKANIWACGRSLYTGLSGEEQPVLMWVTSKGAGQLSSSIQRTLLPSGRLHMTGVLAPAAMPFPPWGAGLWNFSPYTVSTQVFRQWVTSTGSCRPHSINKYGSATEAGTLLGLWGL